MRSMSPVPQSGKHISAVGLALVVTFLWSTSWVLIKLGLRADLPALSFAGLRYTIAFVCLLPLIWVNPAHRRVVETLSRRQWTQLAVWGVVFYTLTQGAQFVSLAYLPAATLTLILNFSPLFVALLGVLIGGESPTIAQWGGIALAITGAAVYFATEVSLTGPLTGMVVAGVGVLANSAAAIMGRQVNSQSGLPALVVTTVSMGIGGVLLFGIGVVTQGLGQLGPTEWGLIAWLAVVNTAVAFTLWSRSQQTLTAVESSLINGLMLPQIAVLAWVFLGEILEVNEIIGMAMVGIGVVVVQIGAHWHRFVRRFREDRGPGTG